MSNNDAGRAMASQGSSRMPSIAPAPAPRPGGSVQSIRPRAASSSSKPPSVVPQNGGNGTAAPKPAAPAPAPSTTKPPSTGAVTAGKRETREDTHTDDADSDEDAHGASNGKKRKRTKRSMGKACVYCRRSHMVCEGGRPCERCIKRDIAHLCRDFTPPPHSHPHRSSTTEPEPSASAPTQTLPQTIPAAALNFDAPSSQTSSGINGLQNGFNNPASQIPLYSDPNFPPAWPLLPDTAGPVTYGDVGGSNEMTREGSMQNWGMADDSELGALSKFLGDLGVPSLPGGFLDVLSYFSRGGGGGNNLAGVPMPGVSNIKEEPQDVGSASTSLMDPLASQQGAGPSLLVDDSTLLPSGQPASGSMNTASANMSRTDSNQSKVKGKEPASGRGNLGNLSRIERYFLAAADQPSGPRSSRLAQVIKAKYDAGLLKPYDYVKGYERIIRWMESGRASPKADSMAGSVPSSPARGSARGKLAMTSVTPQSGYGQAISNDSRRRILAAMNGFRPKFRQIARTLTEVDLVFIEEAMERWMLQYDRAFASIHTPSCIWRRTGEIQKANQEFANLTGVPASMFRNGQLCVYELMDEDSAVRYWEGYAKIAFDAGQRSLYTTCTLKVPSSLTRLPPRQPFATPQGIVKAAAAGPPAQIPDLALPQSLLGNSAMPPESSEPTVSGETFREIRCCFSVTIRRDAWGVPVAIMGQWIPI